MRIIEITVDAKGQSKVETPRLHRRRVPRSKQVHRAGPWSAHRREADRRVLPGPAVDQQLKQSN